MKSHFSTTADILLVSRYRIEPGPANHYTIELYNTTRTSKATVQNAQEAKKKNDRPQHAPLPPIHPLTRVPPRTPSPPLLPPPTSRPPSSRSRPRSHSQSTAPPAGAPARPHAPHKNPPSQRAPSPAPSPPPSQARAPAAAAAAAAPPRAAAARRPRPRARPSRARAPSRARYAARAFAVRPLPLRLEPAPARRRRRRRRSRHHRRARAPVRHRHRSRSRRRGARCVRERVARPRVLVLLRTEDARHQAFLPPVPLDAPVREPQRRAERLPPQPLCRERAERRCRCHRGRGWGRGRALGELRDGLAEEARGEGARLEQHGEVRACPERARRRRLPVDHACLSSAVVSVGRARSKAEEGTHDFRVVVFVHEHVLQAQIVAVEPEHLFPTTTTTTTTTTTGVDPRADTDREPLHHPHPPRHLLP